MGEPVRDTGQPGARTLRTARAILLLTAAEVVGKLGTLVVVVGAARRLELADFGVFSVALAVGVIVAVVPSWGFDTVVVQRGAANPAELPTLLAELLVLRGAVLAATLAAVVAVVSVRGAATSVVVSIVCVVAAGLAETITEAYRAVALARHRQGVVALAQVVQRGATALLALAALGWRPSLLALSVAYLAGTLVGTAAAAVGATRLGIRPRWGGLGWRGTRRLFQVSWSAGAHSVASMALFRADAVLLAVLAGAVAAGQYAAAYRLLETVVFVCWTVGRVLFPVMAETTEPWRVRRGADRGVVVLAAVFLPYAALLWCRGGDLLRLLYGAPFARDGVAVLAWLAPAPLLFGVAWLAASVLMSGGPAPSVLVGSVGALVVNLVLNLVLIPRYGPAGAAVATSAAYAVELALLYPAVRRRVGPGTLARPLLPAVVGAVLLAGVLLAPLPLGVVLLLGVPVYLGVWYRLARWLDPEQVEVIRGLLSRPAGPGPVAPAASAPTAASAPAGLTREVS